MLALTDGEPTRLIEAWTGAALAVVVDAVRPSRPGRAGCTGSNWTGPWPGRRGPRARTGSAWMTRSGWRSRWTGCPAAHRARDRGGRPDPGHRPDLAGRCGRGRGGQRRSRRPTRYRQPGLTRRQAAYAGPAAARSARTGPVGPPPPPRTASPPEPRTAQFRQPLPLPAGALGRILEVGLAGRAQRHAPSAGP